MRHTRSAKIMIDNTSPFIFGYSTPLRRERSGRRSFVSCSGSIRTKIASAPNVSTIAIWLVPAG